jgi:hypothetical protein
MTIELRIRCRGDLRYCLMAGAVIAFLRDTLQSTLWNFVLDAEADKQRQFIYIVVFGLLGRLL